MSIHIDRPTKEKIKLAHPKLRDELEGLVEKINKDVLTGRAKMRITHTLRSFEEQEALYAQGRETLEEVNAKRKEAGLQPIKSSENRRVTNAKGGSSYHNFAIAFDFVLIVNGVSASWDTKKDFDQDLQSDWMEVVKVFEDAGYTWGGRFRTIKDYPHFEKTFGNTISTLKRKYQNKQFIPGTEYVRI